MELHEGRDEDVAREVAAVAPQGADKKKYRGLEAHEMRRLRQLEDENAKLKRVVADLTLDKIMLQVVLTKKL